MGGGGETFLWVVGGRWRCILDGWGWEIIFIGR